MSEHRPLSAAGTVWGPTATFDALKQVARSLEHTTSLRADVSTDGPRLWTKDEGRVGRQGVLSAHAEVSDAEVRLELEIARTRNARTDVVTFTAGLAALGASALLVEPVKLDDGRWSLRLGVRLQATPLTTARLSRLEDTLRSVDTLARSLQGDLPCFEEADLRKRYAGFEDALSPVAVDRMDVDPAAHVWLCECLDLLAAGVSVALVGESRVERDHALHRLATALSPTGRTLGLVVPHVISSRGLLELTRRAPGWVAVRADQLSAGSGAFDLVRDVSALLATLRGGGTPLVITGSAPALERLLASGQGFVRDPLLPVVRRLPRPELDDLVRFAVQASARTAGLGSGHEDALRSAVRSALDHVREADRRRIVVEVAHAAVNARAQGVADLDTTTRRVAIELGDRLDGHRSAVVLTRVTSRSRAFADRVTCAVMDPDLPGYFAARLLGQDRALVEMAQTLRREALTRPAHQPYRYCAQGTPGIGKSESARLLAERLDVPYLYVDAAQTDPYTATAQLKGSGLGLVGSDRAGRLERAAKQGGAVLEVADLDHATPGARAALSETFLQLLDTGITETATGVTFSCADLLIVFTLNLPGGADERVHRGLGFSPQGDLRAVHQQRVVSELRKILSGALLSRLGVPILFEPLAPAHLADILERATLDACRIAVERLGVVAAADSPLVSLAPGTGAALLAGVDPVTRSLGARGLADFARSRVADALADLLKGAGRVSPGPLEISPGQGTTLSIVPRAS